MSTTCRPSGHSSYNKFRETRSTSAVVLLTRNASSSICLICGAWMWTWLMNTFGNIRYLRLTASSTMTWPLQSTNILLFKLSSWTNETYTTFLKDQWSSLTGSSNPRNILSKNNWNSRKWHKQSYTCYISCKGLEPSSPSLRVRSSLKGSPSKPPPLLQLCCSWQCIRAEIFACKVARCWGRFILKSFPLLRAR